MPDVIGYGQAVMDLCMTFDQRPGVNEAAFATELSWQYGGTVPTGLCATRILSGCSCGMVTAYGGSVGQFIIQDLVRHGIDVSHAIERPEQTSRLTVVLSYEGSRSPCGLPHMLTDLQPEEIDPAYLDGAKYLYTHKYLPGHIQAAKIAHEKGIKVVLDGDNYGQGTPSLLPYVDYCIISEKFYHDMYHQEGSIETNLTNLRSLCAAGAVVILTQGEKGLTGLDDDGFFHLEAFKVDVVDTAGCGDVFHGAFIAGLLRGMDNKTCARYASGCSAIKATRIGCRAGIPTHEVLMHFLETGEIDYTEIDQRIAYYSKMPTIINP